MPRIRGRSGCFSLLEESATACRTTPRERKVAAYFNPRMALKKRCMTARLYIAAFLMRRYLAFDALVCSDGNCRFSFFGSPTLATGAPVELEKHRDRPQNFPHLAGDVPVANFTRSDALGS